MLGSNLSVLPYPTQRDSKRYSNLVKRLNQGNVAYGRGFAYPPGGFSAGMKNDRRRRLHHFDRGLAAARTGLVSLWRPVLSGREARTVF